METLSWHQAAASRRNYRLRNKPAHIRRADWIRSGRMLCGRNDGQAPVTIEAAHRGNPANKPCAHCKRIADTLNLS